LRGVRLEILTFEPIKPRIRRDAEKTANRNAGRTLSCDLAWE
jgi:hypothetical protein